MKKWLELSNDQRKQMIIQTSNQETYTLEAIEKDWYVTLALQAVFQSQWAPHIVFKGGTSLSKGWGLITRFSEDVDLAIDPAALQMPIEAINGPGDIKKLRKASKAFMEGPFLAELTDIIYNRMGIPTTALDLRVQPVPNSDADPRIIELEYPTLFPAGNYIRSRVLLEVGARSLREPFTQRPIQSMVSAFYKTHASSVAAFDIPTVNPERTFLEKMFLLHEEFTKPEAKRRHDRLSRHLYDINRLKDSVHGQQALADNELFTTIRTHRGKFNAYDHVDYNTITLRDLIIVPPDEVIDNWRADYGQMQQTMFGDDAPSFDNVIANLAALAATLRQ